MMFHGLIEIPDDTFSYLGEPGDYCQVTAYLPGDERFAIYGKQWITFQWAEEEFLKTFNYIKPEDCWNIEELENFDY